MAYFEQDSQIEKKYEYEAREGALERNCKKA
jgi:hypothetical protein